MDGFATPETETVKPCAAGLLVAGGRSSLQSFVATTVHAVTESSR